MLAKKLCALILAALLLLSTAALAENEPVWLLDELNTTDIYGEPVDLSLFVEDELVMVNVWATYCPPCLQEMSDLGKLSEKWAAEGVRIVGLVSDVIDGSLNPDAAQLELAQTIAEQTGASYTHLVPDLRLVMKVLSGIQYVPTTFFVKPDGSLTGGVYVGARSYEQWDEVIDDTWKELQGV